MNDDTNVMDWVPTDKDQKRVLDAVLQAGRSTGVMLTKVTASFPQPVNDSEAFRRVRWNAVIMNVDSFSAQVPDMKHPGAFKTFTPQKSVSGLMHLTTTPAGDSLYTTALREATFQLLMETMPEGLLMSQARFCYHVLPSDNVLLSAAFVTLVTMLERRFLMNEKVSVKAVFDSVDQMLRQELSDHLNRAKEKIEANRDWK